MFDDGNTLSIGAIAVQPDNPDVVYVGTGEGAVRNSVSFGDGIYKTTDGGRTWTHLGLRDSERFSRIVIHPANPRIVLAAAMGHAFGRNPERGIFRSDDGGATWQRTLFVNDTTGASDVAIDPEDPSIVYAGMYDYLRQPWTLRSGGPGSGLFRSSDGGVTWTKLTDPALKNGLPGAQLLGRVGVAIARSNPNVVYALIDAQEDGVLWRSTDRGRTCALDRPGPADAAHLRHGRRVLHLQRPRPHVGRREQHADGAGLPRGRGHGRSLPRAGWLPGPRDLARAQREVEPGRINWLTIQVGKYSGRPTAAQVEWIERDTQMTNETAAKLEAVEAGSLARLNGALRAAGLAEVR